MSAKKPSDLTFVTRMEAAELFRCSVQQIDKYIQAGHFQPYYFGRKVLLRRLQLFQKLESSSLPPLPRKSEAAR